MTLQMIARQRTIILVKDEQKVIKDGTTDSLITEDLDTV